MWTMWAGGQHWFNRSELGRNGSCIFIVLSGEDFAPRGHLAMPGKIFFTFIAGGWVLLAPGG